MICALHLPAGAVEQSNTSVLDGSRETGVVNVGPRRGRKTAQDGEGSTNPCADKQISKDGQLTVYGRALAEASWERNQDGYRWLIPHDR